MATSSGPLNMLLIAMTTFASVSSCKSRKIQGGITLASEAHPVLPILPLLPQRSKQNWPDPNFCEEFPIGRTPMGHASD
eukprot:765309-Hanusia_phi.AAC.3